MFLDICLTDDFPLSNSETGLEEIETARTQSISSDGSLFEVQLWEAILHLRVRPVDVRSKQFLRGVHVLPQQ